tara:strand:+ start:2035 stop:2178 length:144 start_codon:yes stop_codon:yes gene_type:complete
MILTLIAIAILVTGFAIVTILKKGLNEIITGLNAIEERLKETTKKDD